jgi:hypothetical protein
MNTLRFYTRLELATEMVRGLYGYCKDADILLNYYMLCDENEFIRDCSVPLKSIRKNIYYA